MSELRPIKVEEIKDLVSYTPNIPDNWYVPANRAWTCCAWFILQLKDGKRFSNDEQVNRCLEIIEQWIEDQAVAFGEERR